MTALHAILKFAAVGLVANEIRGLIMAGPVIAAFYHSGGTLMALWLAFCSLAGIVLSVLVPWFVARRVSFAGKQQSAR